ncbi:hypothetical protein [Nesterenkonia natronophila]|uniref:Uncharacterized protein n=1 Tax=Nesterenkonia natronophila TaxID=2174932 RepID=A0A3A4F0P2_9MICC|nr:hypothetical protein [Nesterenkonia natronophila]RJN31742.1 hypothetical protein D3250_06320 [Nesterenkonia natronophila]
MADDQRRLFAPAQLTRGALAALVGVGSAVLAHAAAGHHSPHFLVVILALVVSLPICVQLSGTLMSPGRLAGAVLGSQVVLHGLFALFPGPTLTSSGLARESHAHHGVTANASLQRAADSPDPATLVETGGGAAPSLAAQTETTMLLAHLVAALSALGLFCFGDALVRGMVDRIAIAPALMLLDLDLSRNIPPPSDADTARRVENAPIAWLGSGPRTLRGPPSLVK